MTRPAVNEGWEERLATILDFLDLSVTVNTRVLSGRNGGLTLEEWNRLGPKIKMVEEFAGHMAENMLKGTVKYTSDEYAVETWLAEEEDDTVDLVNYSLLRRDAMEQAELVRLRG